MIRVRGIYSTALAGLLDEFGYPFSDITEKIRERVSHARLVGGAAAVTVKDLEDRKGVVVVGDGEAVKLVAYSIAAALTDVLVSYIPMGPYTSVVARVIERSSGSTYVVELPGGGKGLLEARRELREGDLIRAHIVRPDPEKPLLREGLAVVGSYARLIEYAVHGVSEHIRDYERAAELLSMAQMVVPEGWGVRFRSSAGTAQLMNVIEELRSLVERAKSLRDTSTEVSAPTLLASGEAIAFLLFSPATALRLDSVRDRYFRTAPFHHLLKSLGDKRLSDFVDKVEAEGSWNREVLLDVLAEQLKRNLVKGQVVLIHRKPRGEGYSWFADASVSADGFLLLSRSVKSEGVYDGLGVSKEPGDRILSVCWPFSRVIAHFYFGGGGRLKGVYVNVNSPLDFALAPRPAFIYVDLHLDVVRVGDEIRLIDEDKFRALVEEGVLLRRDAALYECLAMGVSKALRESDEPLELAQQLLNVQSKCFERDPIESFKLAVMERLGELGGRAIRSLEDEVHRVH